MIWSCFSANLTGVLNIIEGNMNGGDVWEYIRREFNFKGQEREEYGFKKTPTPNIQQR